MSTLSTIAGEAVLAELKGHVSARADHPLGVTLLVDADRTLGADDTGRLVGRALGVDQAIRRIFEDNGYLDDAFMSVSNVWSSIRVDAYLEAIARVAQAVQIRAAWVEILRAVADSIPVIAITAGIPQVWMIALSNAGFDEVPVLGGCHRDLDRYTVSARSKGEIVRVLQALGWIVVAAGDSCVDLPMLAAADVRLFIPDHKGSASLRAELARVPDVWHLLVDEQRFDGMKTCSAADAISMMLRGGVWHDH
jgi:phosphoserine phosphatase